MKSISVLKSKPCTSELIYESIKELCEKYRFIGCECIGKSVMNTDIWSLTLGRGERKVFFNGAHHANEWITAPLLINFIADYAKAIENREEICGIDARQLFVKKKLCCVPLVNPDGVDLVNGAIDKTSLFFSDARNIARRYPQIPFPSGWKANICGTDLNLNYPALWGEAKRIKYALGIEGPAPENYVGPMPLSEPESRAIYDYTLKNGFYLTLSYHTQGQVIYWKYFDFLPENSEEIAEKLSKASGYKLEITPRDSGHAGYKDWFISCYNKPGYTVEAGIGTNPLPLSQFDEIYADNKPLLTLALDLA